MSIRARILKLSDQVSRIVNSVKFHFIDKSAITESMALDESNIYVYLDL